jgi:PAS domain S-box-containing protein
VPNQDIALEPVLPGSRLVRYLPLWVSILAVIVIATVTAMLSANIRELIRTRTMVDHTNAVIHALDGILVAMEEAESRQRGYLLTGDSSFLRHDTLRAAIDSGLAELATLVRDNAEQTADVPLLAGTVRRRLQRIDTTLTVRAARGMPAALALVREGRGTRLMDTVRMRTGIMKERELRLLARRSEAERASLTRAKYIGAFGVLLAAVLFIVAVVLIRRTLIALAAGRRSASRAAALLQSTSDGIYGLDTDGRLTFVNRAMAEALGYTEAEVVGRRCHPLLHHTRPDGSPYPLEDCPICQVTHAGTEGRFENEIIWRKDGTSMAVEYVVSSLRGSRRGGAVVSFRDTTDRQRADAALREGKLAAEAANRAKSDFLARMSHELRTPLNSVIGFANVLLRNKAENLRPQDLTYVERIQKNGVHLLGLINDILDLSKIEAGRVEIDVEPVDLGAKVREVAAQFEPHLADRPVRLVTRIPSRLATIETDRGKLRQVLTNLVSNALKFTAQGEVTLEIEADPDGQPRAIRVTDSGIGIPAGRMSAIFDPFEQADKTTTRKYGGTGLGLPISRSLCQLLGFDLHVQSVEGKGSTFTIDLRPRAARSLDVMPSPDAAHAADEGILRGRMVLIIDDEADARTLIAHQVAALGGRSAGAATGADGMRLARDLKPDLITLDLLMPGMDGREIMEAFKADPDLSHIPIVVVSIVAREHGAALVGAVSALSKPLDRSELTTALKHALGLGRVLVVDDDADTRHLLAEYVFAAGAAEVRIASDGHAAVAAIPEFQPDLILLDLLMPNGDGEAVLSAIAARPPEAHPCSVIIVTSKELSAGELRRFELATLGVLHKGAELEANLRRALNEFAVTRRRPSPREVARVEVAPDA